MLDAAREAEAAAAIDSAGVRRLRNAGGALPAALDPFPATLVKSPGIRRDAPLIASALSTGLTVIDEAELGWRLDSRPLIGITGTNGKSTVAALTVALLEAAGMRGELAGNTTFGPPLSAMRGDGDVVVAEISSFQLEGCTELLPEAAVLTNLTQDHYYRHGDADGYAACKRGMFVRGSRATPAAAIGVDQQFGRDLARELESMGARVVRFGLDGSSDRAVLGSEWSLAGGSVTLREGDDARTLRTRLPGRHNALNVAAAFALSDALELDPDTTARAIESVEPPPGRMELVAATAGREIFADYAHNPDGVAQSLGAARAVLDRRGKGRLVAVVSSLSFSGELQSRALGRAAGERADVVVLTSHRWTPEEPFGTIAPGLREGAASGGRARVFTEPDRRGAIGAALSTSAPGDVVMILERGASRGRLYDCDDQAIEFDDREVARELAAEIFTAS